MLYMFLMNANSEAGFSLRVTVSVWSNGSCFIVVSITGRASKSFSTLVWRRPVSRMPSERRGEEKRKRMGELREGMKEKWVSVRRSSLFVETSVKE